MTRDTVFQAVHVAREVTAGTDPGSGTVDLLAMSIEPAPQTEVVTFAPRGSKYDTLAVVGKDWTTADISGLATYTEIIMPLSSVLDAATISSGAESNTWSWNFQPDYDAADAPKSFTVQVGDGNTSEKFTYGRVNDFTVTFTRDSVDISGSMIGQLYSVNQGALAAASATAELKPVLPTTVDVYLDSTYGALGSTKLEGLLQCVWGITGRYSPKWEINSANSSWDELVEIKPAGTMSLTIEAVGTATTLITDLRAGNTKYIRILASGGLVSGATATNFGLTIDTAVKFQNISSLDDQDGVLALTYDFVWTPDSNWAGPCNVTVDNDVATLTFV